jgi:hypothetical protein
MTYKNMHARSGLTAIAAVLALSSTPLVAQETTAPPDPVIETPSEPAPAADPLAPEPAASEPTAIEPASTEAAPAATTRRAAARSRTAATNRAPSEPVRTAAPAIAPQPPETAAEAIPVPPLPAEPVAEPVAPLAADPVTASNELMTDESLPLAGAAGLGLLALGGIGLAMQRRRRRREELEHYRANQQYLDKHPVAEISNDRQPAFARTAPPAAAIAAASTLPEAEVRTDVPRTKLPSNFDLSRFGPHVRAAYMGPTPDNPSLSLKYRLRRAGAMDQRVRLEAGTQPQAAKPAKRPEPAKQPAWVTNGDGFMLRRASGGQPSRRPAFQN